MPFCCFRPRAEPPDASGETYEEQGLRAGASGARRPYQSPRRSRVAAVACHANSITYANGLSPSSAGSKPRASLAQPVHSQPLDYGAFQASCRALAGDVLGTAAAQPLLAVACAVDTGPLDEGYRVPVDGRLGIEIRKHLANGQGGVRLRAVWLSGAALSSSPTSLASPPAAELEDLLSAALQRDALLTAAIAEVAGYVGSQTPHHTLFAVRGALAVPLQCPHCHVQ
jgi:hypothetical protein